MGRCDMEFWCISEVSVAVRRFAMIDDEDKAAAEARFAWQLTSYRCSTAKSSCFVAFELWLVLEVLSRFQVIQKLGEGTYGKVLA